MAAQLVMYEEEHRKLNSVCDRLNKEANSKIVFLVDRNGQLISGIGQTGNIDTTSLASLTAGNVAAMGGLAKLIGEADFPNQFHEGVSHSIYMALIGRQVVLVVIFDKHSTLGLVRLRVKKASDEIERILHTISTRAAAPGVQSPFAELSDADIDTLFSE